MTDATRNLITPRQWDSDERLRLHVSADDYAQIKRGPGWRATVTDLDTGKRYQVKSAPCSLPRCYCDAIAIELE